MKLLFQDGSELEALNICSTGVDSEFLYIEVLDGDYSEIYSCLSNPCKTATISVYSGSVLISSYLDYCDIKTININNDFYVDKETHTKIVFCLTQIYTKQKLQNLTDRVNTLQKTQKLLSEDQKTISKTQEEITGKVNAIDSNINPVVDLNSMNMTELIAYKIGEFGNRCSSIIEAGSDAQTSFGTEHFSYSNDDQKNLKTAFDMAYNGLSVPYHADKKDCRIFSPGEILAIYGACEGNKTYQTTYCNIMNGVVRSIEDQEAILKMNYGDELPEGKQKILQENMKQTELVFETIKNTLMEKLFLAASKMNEELEAGICAE